MHLGKDLTVELLCIAQEHGVAVTHLASLLKHPVGNAAIAHLTMTERTHAQDDRHLFLLAYLQEAPQVALAVPAEDALFLLHMIPEHVGGNDCHPTLFHLSHLLLPLVGRYARIVNLAHHGTDAPAVHHQAIPVPCHLFSQFRCRLFSQFRRLHTEGTACTQHDQQKEIPLHVRFCLLVSSVIFISERSAFAPK